MIRLALIAVLVAVSGCNYYPLKRLERIIPVDENVARASVSFCTLDARSVKSQLKFIFIMDKSGSNQISASGVGTDPDGLRRYVPLLSYLEENALARDDSVFYSLINFSTGDDVHTNVVQGFTNNVDAFKATVRGQHNAAGPNQPLDEGWTDYLAALDLAKTLIQEDVRLAETRPDPISSDYVIFFISDGAPQIGVTVDFPYEPIYQDTNEILGRVRVIKDLEESNSIYVGSVQLHAGYYFNGSPDTRAQNLERAMAEEGAGDFYSFGEGQSIDFSRFNVDERKVKHALKDIFVENRSTVWEQGNLLLDSDFDMLSDSLEIRLGSNPNLKDSDGNGIGDGVEYRVYGTPCGNQQCATVGARDYPACAQYKKNGKYTDIDKDGLNDCEEEELIHSNREDFDTNRDFIPDELAFFRGVGILQGQSEADLDPDLDNLSNYAEIKAGTPHLNNNKEYLGLSSQKYSLRLVESTAEKDCYELEVEQIGLWGQNDLIRVHILENTTVIDHERFYRIAEKRVSNRKVSFSNSDFK